MLHPKQNHNTLYTVSSQATSVQHPGQHPIMTDLKMKQAPGKRRKQKLIAEISIPDPLPSYIGTVLSFCDKCYEIECDACKK